MDRFSNFDISWSGDMSVKLFALRVALRLVLWWLSGGLIGDMCTAAIFFCCVCAGWLAAFGRGCLNWTWPNA